MIKLLVLQDFLAGLRDQLEDLVLDVLQLPLELRQLDHRLALLLLQFGLLVLHHLHQQLVFQALRRHSEVYQCNLNAYLRQVVGIRQLCCDVESEVRVVWHNLVTNFDLQLPTVLSNRLRQNRL